MRRAHDRLSVLVLVSGEDDSAGRRLLASSSSQVLASRSLSIVSLVGRQVRPPTPCLGREELEVLERGSLVLRDQDEDYAAVFPSGGWLWIKRVIQ